MKKFQTPTPIRVTKQNLISILEDINKKGYKQAEIYNQDSSEGIILSIPEIKYLIELDLPIYNLLPAEYNPNKPN